MLLKVDLVKDCYTNSMCCVGDLPAIAFLNMVARGTIMSPESPVAIDGMRELVLSCPGASSPTTTDPTPPPTSARRGAEGEADKEGRIAEISQIMNIKPSAPRRVQKSDVHPAELINRTNPNPVKEVVLRWCCCSRKPDVAFGSLAILLHIGATPEAPALGSTPSRLKHLLPWSEMEFSNRYAALSDEPPTLMMVLQSTLHQ
ncbi:hypothetical protein INR49_017189 [Caranx melampygus]|nr:hypothetical protein INR49_017189 [Caranx melampygus]